MRPIVEIMTVNFSLLALDQIVNNAATIPHMSGGQFAVPLVIRMATGAGRQLAAQHSHSLEGWYAHIPGLKIVAPATLEDARGMLWSALQDANPVLIFEHVNLYNMEGELAADAGPVPLAGAALRRPGRDLTVVTYGASLHKSLAAAEQLAAEGIEAEVIDLRVLRPLDDADDHGLRRPHAPRADRRRGLALGRHFRRDLRPHRRAGLLRPRRAAGTTVRRRGADPLSQASGGCGDPSGRHDPRRRA